MHVVTHLFRSRSSLVMTTVAALAASVVVAVPGAQASAPGGDGLRLESVSAHPDLVTAGDVLVRAKVPRDRALGDVRVTLNGADVTGSFRSDATAHTLTGLVDHLEPGRNRIAATAGTLHDDLVVTNHPAAGPVLSGPQEQPYICTTDQFQLIDGSTLGPPSDSSCSVTTRVDYAYRSTDGTIKPLPDVRSRPDDLAWTTTTTGRDVPFLIRIETGTLNRSIYQIAMLHDPTTPAPTFFRHSPGWNNRLVYTFGGGCRGGWYSQGHGTGGVLDPEMLRRGYAVASASLNVFGNNCNDLLATETMMMVKERFVEQYGSPLFTIGWGCSGGSYQSHQIADNYPGLLNGIVVGCSFPDVASATIFTLFDSRLLDHYFNSIAPNEFSREQQRTVSGFLKWESIPNLSDNAQRLDPDAEFPAEVPLGLRYNAQTNPTGARGDVYDHTVNVYGRDPSTGFARRPLDNVGVQYGLAALNSGAITKRQFLDLNAGIGGLDADANPTAQRTAADPVATGAAYRTGRILSGGGGLDTTPIIDYRGYSEDGPNGDIHMLVHQFATRARLVAANGDADNQVMLVEDGRYGLFSLDSPVLRDALTQMDQWLTNLADEGAGTPSHAQVVATKPAGLTDACWTRDAAHRKIVQRLSAENPGECGRLFPARPTPRLVAGAPLTDDVVTCHRKPVDWNDYRVDFTPAERTELEGIFRSGVCDWTKPGVGQQPLAGTWQTF